MNTLNDLWFKAMSENTDGVALTVDSMQKKWRDSFTRPLTEVWDVVQSGGSTATSTAGVLTLASGTTAGGFTELLSKETFTLPFRAMFGVQNARHASNHQIMEMVSVDHVTGLPDGRHSAQIDIGGAASVTATQMLYYVQNGGLVPLASAASTIVTTAAYSILELEPFADETYFHSRSVDTTTGRANSYVRHQQIPDPNAEYKLRLRSMNHGAWKNVTGAVAGTGGTIRLTITAHAYTGTVWVETLNGVTNGTAEVRGNYVITVVDANTIELNGTTFAGAYVAGSGRAAMAAAPTAVTMQFQFANVQDYAELTAEITAGRGSSVEGQAIAARFTGAIPAGTANIGAVNSTSVNNIFYNDSVTAQAAAATVTGTARDAGVAVSVNHRYSAFNAAAFADQPGTMRIEVSNDNTTWRRITADVTVAANTPVVLSVPVVTRYYRVVYVNGATLQGAFMLNTSFTGA